MIMMILITIRRETNSRQLKRNELNHYSDLSRTIRSMRSMTHQLFR